MLDDDKVWQYGVIHNDSVTLAWLDKPRWWRSRRSSRDGAQTATIDREYAGLTLANKKDDASVSVTRLEAAMSSRCLCGCVDCSVAGVCVTRGVGGILWVEEWIVVCGRLKMDGCGGRQSVGRSMRLLA